MTAIDFKAPGALPRTPEELHALCTAIHAVLVDDPIMLWMPVSFEDMADYLMRAVASVDEADAMNREFAGMRQGLAA